MKPNHPKYAREPSRVFGHLHIKIPNDGGSLSHKTRQRNHKAMTPQIGKTNKQNKWYRLPFLLDKLVVGAVLLVVDFYVWLGHLEQVDQQGDYRQWKGAQ